MKKLVIATVLFLSFNCATFAQLFPVLGEQRVGISTAQFLKIGAGGRATAMGDAFVAVADDATAMYWNPAGLVQFNRNEVIVSHNKWLVDIDHNFFGAVYHLGVNDALGFSVTSVTMDQMKRTTEFQPFGTGEFFNVSDFAFSLTYAKRMTDKFSFGGTVKYVHSTLAELTMSGFLVDLGTYYWTGLGTSRFAVTFSNFGGQLQPNGDIVAVGSNEKISDWQQFSPPTMFRLGFAVEPYQTEIQRVTLSAQLNHPNDNSESLSLGSEYAYAMPSFGTELSARAGYKLNVEGQDISAGIGLEQNFNVISVGFDYSFVRFDKFGSVHRLTVTLGL